MRSGRSQSNHIRGSRSSITVSLRSAVTGGTGHNPLLLNTNHGPTNSGLTTSGVTAPGTTVPAMNEAAFFESFPSV